MIELDQATLNFRYAQAQERRMSRLYKENLQLREIIEALRIHLVQLGKTQGNRPHEITKSNP